MKVTALVFVSLVLGCAAEHKLSEADCALVKDRLQKAWHRDAIAAQRLADTDAFNGFIRDEGDRIAEAFEEECSRMIGRVVRPGELECMSKAETIDDVYECAK